MPLVFSKTDESVGTKRRKASLRPITGVVSGTRPALRLEYVRKRMLKSKTDQAGEVVGYEAPEVFAAPLQWEEKGARLIIRRLLTE